MPLLPYFLFAGQIAFRTCYSVLISGILPE